MSSNFDLASLALKSAFPTNSILVDDKGLPSVMVYIPKFKISDVIAGGSDTTHPAFIVDGVEKNGIYISKYQNKVYGGRAYSLPGEDPANSLTFETALGYCSAKGPGWHLMTTAEWAAIALWCKHNAFLPWGNNNYGKDSRESSYIAIPTFSSGGQTCRVATGTGPIKWSHNQQLNGIYDLNGNVAEWNGGLRLVYGELQILENNNAANPDNSQGASSAQWKAIKGSDGTLITPDGSGTTTGAIRLDYVSSKWKWITGTPGSQTDESRYCTFVNVQADTDTIGTAALELLKALICLPDDITFDYEGDYFYANNGAAERSPYRGGYWYYGADYGVFCTNLSGPRSISGADIGFRSAFYE